MAQNVEVGMRDLPREVRNKLYRRQGARPDMTISTGPIQAGVVFHAHEEGFSAYYRMSEKGERPVTQVITEPTQDAVTQRVLGIIFHRDQVKTAPVRAMDFRQYAVGK